MTTPEEDPLESFWQDLRPANLAPRPLDEGLIKVNSGKVTDLDASLEMACAKATQELSTLFARHQGVMMTTELLAEVVATGVRVFMEKWREGLKGSDLAGLIEIVLEGQSLPLEELRGFVRALPTPLLERVAKSALGAASGTHGLMAIEHARRAGTLRNYTLGQDSGKLYAEFTHPQAEGEQEGETIRFYLNDEFHVPEEPPPPPVEPVPLIEPAQEDSAQDGQLPPPGR